MSEYEQRVSSLACGLREERLEIVWIPDLQQLQRYADPRAAASVSRSSGTVDTSAGRLQDSDARDSRERLLQQLEPLGGQSLDMNDKPVMFPPGRARFGPSRFPPDLR